MSNTTPIPHEEARAQARWRALAGQIQTLHPNGATAVATAEGAGLDPADFSGCVCTGGDLPPEAYPVLYFGDWADGDDYFVVSPGRVGRYTPIARGEGQAVAS